MDQAYWSAAVTILLALLGYLATYWNNLRLSQHKDKLDRINRQLSDLYGPMFSLTHASNIAWQGFRSKHRPDRSYFDGTVLPEEDLAEWRLWMSKVFMPINIQLYDIILTKSDLLIETEMPQCLLLFCAHVAAYQAVLEKWANKDYSEHLSVVGYPGEIEQYAQRSYAEIKSRQAILLGEKKIRPSFSPTKIQ